MRNPKFKALLDKMLELHEKKNSDYASDSDPYSNFSFAANFADVPLLKIYLTLVGVKAARLIELVGKKEPLNESINDTLLDFAVYATIMASHLMVEDNPEISSTSFTCCSCKHQFYFVVGKPYCQVNPCLPPHTCHTSELWIAPFEL